MGLAVHSPGYFAHVHDATLDRYAIRHRRGFVTLPANQTQTESIPHVCALGTCPPGAPENPRSSPAGPFYDVICQHPEVGGLHSAGSFHSEPDSRGGLG